MFKTLLLATVVGAGAANIPANSNVERSNSPPSYFCSSANKKCSQAKQVSSVSAYCSSYLNIPKTATKTVTTCTTTKVNKTVFTGTTTVPGTTITSVITGCARPTTTPVTPPAGGDAVAGGSSPEGKRDAEPENEKRYGTPKPSCFAAYTKSKDISSACSCLGLKAKSTSTKTVVETKTSTNIVKAVSTATGAPATTSVFSLGAAPTFAVAKENGNYLIFNDAQQKRSMSGLEDNLLVRQTVKEIQSGRLNDPQFASQSFNLDQAILFKLNNPDGLSGQIVVVDAQQNTERVNPAGKILSAFADPASAGLVRFDDPVSPRLTPLTCSLTFNPLDGTCPLDCQVNGPTDLNQENGGSPAWNLAAPGVVSEITYKTFAVTREDPAPAEENSPQPGPDVERGQSGGGNRKRWDWNVPTGHDGATEAPDHEKRQDKFSMDLGVPTGHGGATEAPKNQKREDEDLEEDVLII